MKRREQTQGIALEETQRVAEDIYIYGYPALLMDINRRMHTAAPYPSARSAPVNQFAHERFLPELRETSIAHAQADCLKSSAWLDVSKEPVVLTVPRINRYHLFSFFSGWYEIFGSISPRTATTQGEHFGFAGPHWTGKLPAGVKRVTAPTETIWIDGCFAVDGAEDIELVHRLQDQCRLTPLNEWGTPPMQHSFPFRSDVDQKAPPEEQIDKLDARAFFTRLSSLLQRNPPQLHDNAIVADFAHIGFFPGQDFEFEMLPPHTTLAMHSAVPAAQIRIATAKTAGRNASFNSWSLRIHPGSYQTNYLERATAARSSVAAALAEDLVCFRTVMDQTGEPLTGAKQYVIHFPPNLTPPVNAFWSITMYESQDRLVPNSIHRHVIGDRDRLRHNPDNSLSIYIQHDWPGADKDSNWLPAPRDHFNLALRMYWPKLDVLSEGWRPPAVASGNWG